VRWLYHLRIVTTDDAWPYAPASFANEKFIHASYRDAVQESAALYFRADAKIEILMIDPRKLTALVDVASTPRGPMPHIVGAIAHAAVTRIVPLESFDPKRFPDSILGG
jgi:uncharacterized protein (DUF952 family)